MLEENALFQEEMQQEEILQSEEATQTEAALEKTESSAVNTTILPYHERYYFRYR